MKCSLKYFIHSCISIVNMYCTLGPTGGKVILLADETFHCSSTTFYLREAPKPSHRKTEAIPVIITGRGKKSFSSRLFSPSTSHSFSINPDYVLHTEGEQNRITGWPKQPLGEGKSITRGNKAPFYFPPVLPKMLPSVRSLALPGGQPIPHPRWCGEQPWSGRPHPRDSPARRSPAAPWRRRRGRPGRPRAEPTRGLSSPGSRRNPATQGGGHERETLPEPRGSPRGQRGSQGWSDHGRGELRLWVRKQVGLMLFGASVLIPKGGSWWWG